jgi:peptide/nickel transport system permease protein
MDRSGGGRSLFAIVLQRVFQAVIAIWAVLTIGFLLLTAAPGDPVTFMLGDVSDQALAASIRERLGLDAPLPVRYWTYIDGVLHGQLGHSYIYGRPVVDMIGSRFGPTILLFAAQFVISTILGITLGALSAYKKGSWLDRAVMTLSITWYSLPVFWSGQLLLLLLGLRLEWFPLFGMTSLVTELPAWLDILWHLTLPALTLALLYTAFIARLTRASMVEALAEDYILTARAKGISELAVVRHAFRNALLPVVTILALNVGGVMGGAVLVETVYSWPGMGRLLYQSISTRDYPLVLGLFLGISFVVIVANLVADICYALFDPRIRYR